MSEASVGPDVNQSEGPGQTPCRERDLYEGLLEAAGLGLVALNRQGVIVEINRCGAMLLGQPMEALKGQSLDRFVDAEDRPLWICYLEEFFQNEGGLTRHLKLRPAGDKASVDPSGAENPGVNSHDRVIHAKLQLLPRHRALAASFRHLLITDISNWQWTMDALRETQENFAACMDQLPAIAFIKDEQDRLRFINQHLREQFGEDWAGRTAAEYCPPELAERVLADDRKVLAGQSMLEEFWLPDKSGQMRCYRTAKFPLYQPNKPPLLGGVGVDITDLKQTERAVRAKDERYRLVMLAMREGIWDWDVSTGEVFYSSSYLTMLGYAPERFPLHYQTWCDLLHPDDREKVMAVNQACIDGKCDVYDAEFRVRAADGTWHWILGRGMGLQRDDAGRALRIAGTHQDITARKQAGEALPQGEQLATPQMQQFQKMEFLGILAGGIAHDFNNLLTGILGNADLARMALPPSSSALENIEEIEKAAHRAAELCKQMLAYSGRGRFVVERVALNGLVESMRGLVHATVADRAALRFVLAQASPEIEADAAQLRQVIMNLLSNAVEALGETPGCVTISTGTIFCDRACLSQAYLDERLPEGWYAFLEVADNGCGMDTATQARVFDPFFTTKFTGRGLGLAAVLGIVRGHHGAIKLWSEPGHGTSVKVLFPALAAPAAVVTAEAASPHATVLLVDDEPIVLGFCQRMLEGAGYCVLTAAEGRAALEVYRAHADTIACVVLDMTMPMMNGEETFRELKRIRPDVRVILTSGYTEQEVTSRFTGQGLSGFLQKPFRSAELKAQLAAVLQEKDGQYAMAFSQ